MRLFCARSATNEKSRTVIPVEEEYDTTRESTYVRPRETRNSQSVRETWRVLRRSYIYSPVGFHTLFLHSRHHRHQQRHFINVRVCQSRDSKVRSRPVRALLRLSRRARRISYSTQPTGQAVGDGTVSGRNTLERQFQHAGVVRDSRKYVYDSSGLARLVRRAERDASLIVPNRPARRSATHGPTHGRIRARASKGAYNRDISRRANDREILLYDEILSR